MKESSSERPGPRILIVDDQPANVRLLEHTLKRAGFVDVMSTTDPRQVAAMHLEHRYDLIVLDLQMPDMDGFAVMAQLRGAVPDPVAILVMSADSAQKSAALAAGATSFLAKPYLLGDVVERVQSVLRGS
ncbi:MAG TPA: response regulator [Thermoanaerobaculia bacterium]|jgi:CheY-like chemotaxis protein